MSFSQLTASQRRARTLRKKDTPTIYQKYMMHQAHIRLGLRSCRLHTAKVALNSRAADLLIQPTTSAGSRTTLFCKRSHRLVSW